jgi:peptidyl-prolyl cis-trans isomerase B (cyclophilin B)
MAQRPTTRHYAGPMPVRSSAAYRPLCLAAAVILGLALDACGSTTGADTQLSTTHQSKETASQATNVDSGTSAKKCASVQAPTPKGAQSIPKPTLALDPSRQYVVNLTTNCGTIDIQLDVHRAPRTTASFAYLVRRGFYDNLTFHRVAAGFVIQGGDPNGDGSGGPGYRIVERPPGNMRYTLGTVAMAKTAADPAGASGSQFFIVTARDAPLPAQYALVGNVVGSLASVEAIAKLPTDPPQDGTPTTPVVISHAALSSG